MAGPRYPKSYGSQFRVLPDGQCELVSPRLSSPLPAFSFPYLPFSLPLPLLDPNANLSSSSFFTEALRIGTPDYVPTETDVLRARQKSTGITETRFQLGPLSYVPISLCPLIYLSSLLPFFPSFAPFINLPVFTYARPNFRFTLFLSFKPSSWLGGPWTSCHFIHGVISTTTMINDG